MLFVDGKSTTIYLWLFVAILRLGWAEDVPTDSATTGAIRLRRMIPTASFCTGPPQPTNGHWKLHPRYCSRVVDCNIPQNFPIQSGYELVYTCKPGYKVEGNSQVHCTVKGEWSAIPRCVEVKCATLDSVSRTMTCYNSDTNVNCDSSVLPGTQAQVFCRPGYRKDTVLLLEQGEKVTCNKDGKWEPDPIRCEPACGVAITHQTELVSGGSRANIVDLPWHATVYSQRNTEDGIERQSLCGATIIQANLLLTSAYCVYDEETQNIENPGNLFVMTGAIQRDYDSQLHDLQTVRKSGVKNVYTHCNYTGRVGKYAWDIAILELQQPFMLSSILLPACLDLLGYSEQVLEPGATGTLAGFWRRATGDISENLLTTKVSYISYSQCQPSFNASGFKGLVPKDMFCAGQENVSESSVYNDDTGSGLLFKKNDRRYVMGILSRGLGSEKANAQRTFFGGTPSLYTKVSYHIRWILNVIFNLERHGSHPPCSLNISPVEKTTDEPISKLTPRPMPTPAPTPTHIDISTTTPTALEISCPVPPQLDNGEFTSHRHTTFKPGSKLHYKCNPGYRTSGNTDVYCEETGDWSAIPTCVGIKCEPLNSVSTHASCSQSKKLLDCSFPVAPGTRAEVSCNPGYKKETSFISTRRDNLICNEDGKWQPEPVRCVQVCGVTITHQQPLVAGGITTKIGDLPWHASVHAQWRHDTKKRFLCGATIIHTNFVLTAAHCVYDESNQNVTNAKELFVIAGNVFRDWDHSQHDPKIVEKSGVRSVHVPIGYYGLRGNYAFDIALLTLKESFTFSNVLLPACLYNDGYSDQILEPGAVGKVAGFGSGTLLETITVPYVSYSECRLSEGAGENAFLISSDKFCAGYLNGTAICTGDSGGGLVFKKNDLWYVLGVVSVSLGVNIENGEISCNKNSYTLYTKVDAYLSWIQDTISDYERRKS